MVAVVHQQLLLVMSLEFGMEERDLSVFKCLLLMKACVCVVQTTGHGNSVS